MTTMKRMTISIPDSLDEKILAICKTDDYVRCSYSEIVRQILGLGVERVHTDQQSRAAEAQQDSA